MNQNTYQNDEDLDVQELIAMAIQSWRLILTTTVVTTLLATLLVFNLTPIYELDGVVQVENASSSGFAGALTDITGILEGTQTTTEIELLTSKLVLGKTIEDLNLNIVVKPAYFPMFGKLLADNKNPTIDIPRLDVPVDLFGAAFKVKLIDSKHYSISSWKGGFDEIGTIGKQHVISSDYGDVHIYIRSFDSDVGQSFHVTRNYKLTTVENLQDDLDLSELGKESGIIGIAYKTWNRDLGVKTVNQLLNNYVLQNVERKSAEAQKTLQFLEQQLPEIKSQLEASEVQVNEYRKKNSVLDVSKEGELLLQQSVSVDAGILELQQKKKELSGRFTESHPAVIAINRQIKNLQSQQGKFNTAAGNLPQTEQGLLRLLRDYQVNQELYTTMLNNSQQLRVMKAGTVGSVRIVDYAEPPIVPKSPKKVLTILGAVFLGLIFGVFFSFIKKSLRSGVKSTEDIEAKLNLPVLATVPLSDEQTRLAKSLKGNVDKSLILAHMQSDDLAIESLRSLRTSLNFTLLDAKNNIIMITGAEPSVGKSFITVNFAALLATAGFRVLIVDADLRKGYLNEYFGDSRKKGLSELIIGKVDLAEAIRVTNYENLSYIATGEIPPNPSELILHNRFESILMDCKEQYDYVIIDSPPVLAVTESAIIGRYVGATLLVAKFQYTEMRSLELAVKRLSHAGVEVKGVILNQVKTASGYGYGYKYAYVYNYTKK